jgi:hypothetical protein
MPLVGGARGHQGHGSIRGRVRGSLRRFPRVVAHVRVARRRRTVGGGAGGGSGGGGGLAQERGGGRGLHSSTALAQRKHFMWDTLVDVSLPMSKTAQVELNRGRVYAPRQWRLRGRRQGSGGTRTIAPPRGSGGTRSIAAPAIATGAARQGLTLTRSLRSSI